MLTAKVIWHADRGEVDEAIDTLEVQYALIDSIANEPSILSHLVRVAGRHLSCYSLTGLLNRNRLSEVQYQRVEDILGRGLRNQDAAAAVTAERVRGLSVVLDGPDNPALLRSLDGARPLFLAAVASPDAPKLVADYLEVLDRIETLLRQVHLTHQELDDLDVRLREIRQSENEIARFLLAGFTQLPEKLAESQAAIRLSSLAVNLHRHAAEHGRFPSDPKDLDQLGSSPASVDPFGGAPFRIQRRSPRSATLYSIGRDFTDDQGALRGPGQPTGDIPLVLNAPRRR